MAEAQMTELILMVTRAALLMFCILFAKDNIIGVLKTRDNREDDLMLVIGILVCTVWPTPIIQTVAGVEPQWKIFLYLDYAISGAILAGGPGRFLKGLMEVRTEVKSAAQ